MLWIVLSPLIATPMPAAPAGWCVASTVRDHRSPAVGRSRGATLDVRAVPGFQPVRISANDLTPIAALRHHVSRRKSAGRARVCWTAPVHRFPWPVLGHQARPSREQGRAKQPAAPFQAHAPPSHVRLSPTIT